jgi:hypothetical protein
VDVAENNRSERREKNILGEKIAKATKLLGKGPLGILALSGAGNTTKLVESCRSVTKNMSETLKRRFI